MEDDEFLILMEQSIPEYAMNCFINAGYDMPNIVAQMKTIGNGNSLDEIESFILKHYSDDDSCFPPAAHNRRNSSSGVATTKRRQFVFPPGHRIRITEFINSVKSKYVLTGKKRSSSSTVPVKKQKLSEAAGAMVRTQAIYDLKG